MQRCDQRHQQSAIQIMPRSPPAELSLRSHPGNPGRWIGTQFARTRHGSRRRLRRRLVIGEQMDQRALDRGLPRRRVDLRAQQIGDVEHVAGALAEGRDMGGGDVEVELRDRRRQFVKQTRPVEAGDLDHGIAIRPLVVDG